MVKLNVRKKRMCALDEPDMQDTAGEVGTSS